MRDELGRNFTRGFEDGLFELFVIGAGDHGKVRPDTASAVFDAMALRATDRLMKEQSPSALHIAVAARRMRFVHARAFRIEREIFQRLRVSQVDDPFLIATGRAENLTRFVVNGKKA